MGEGTICCEELTKVHQPRLLRLCWFLGGSGVYIKNQLCSGNSTYLGVSDLFEAPGQMDSSVAGFVLIPSSEGVEA